MTTVAPRCVHILRGRFYDFDGPSETGLLGGGTLGNDVETVVGLGDSGGPAFVDFGSSIVIAGVNTFVYSFEGTPISSPAARS